MEMGVSVWMPEGAILKNEIAFGRLSEIAPTEIADHMSDPRVAEHMPLQTSGWDARMATKFIATKEACWERDGSAIGRFRRTAVTSAGAAFRS